MRLRAFESGALNTRRGIWYGIYGTGLRGIVRGDEAVAWMHGQGPCEGRAILTVYDTRWRRVESIEYDMSDSPLPLHQELLDVLRNAPQPHAAQYTIAPKSAKCSNRKGVTVAVSMVEPATVTAVRHPRGHMIVEHDDGRQKEVARAYDDGTVTVGNFCNVPHHGHTVLAVLQRVQYVSPLWGPMYHRDGHHEQSNLVVSPHSATFGAQTILRMTDMSFHVTVHGKPERRGKLGPKPQPKATLEAQLVEMGLVGAL